MEQSYLNRLRIKKENRIAGLHPGAKLWILIAYVVCTFVLSSLPFTKWKLPLAIIPWFLVVFVLCVVSGVMKTSMKSLKAVVFVAVVIFLVQTFIVPGGEVLWRLGILRICEKGFRTAISLSFMVLDVAGICVWYFQTTSNKEIARALEESGMNHKAVYVFTSSLSMITILSDNSKTIMNAQKARGVETEGNMLIRAKAFFPTLVPLILGAVASAEERVLTLEARGFSVSCEKSHIFHLEKSGLELATKMAATAVTIIVIVGRIILWIR